MRAILASHPLVDIHTHLFDPAFGPLCLWGIDELLTYHYLVAELLRALPDLSYKAFWAMAKPGQADLVWRELFVRRSPVSEACRGVLTVLQRLGLDPNASSLSAIRAYFAGRDLRGYIETVFGQAGIRCVYMTNDPLEPCERKVWLQGFERDSRFRAVLRLDSALMHWPQGGLRLRQLGYNVGEDLSGGTLAEVRRYLHAWCDRMDARYMAISLPPTFTYPQLGSALTTLMTKTVLPVARERGIPAALMIGVKKLVNPALRLAGDSVGRSDLGTLERLAGDFPEVRFLVTLLARENMHELCVVARKFRNLLPFGCWWFLNNPSLIREITAMRLELLGLAFIPQHSDGRVLDQLIYKWVHSRGIIGGVLAAKYGDLMATGRVLTAADVRRDVDLLFNREL